MANLQLAKDILTEQEELLQFLSKYLDKGIRHVEESIPQSC